MLNEYYSFSIIPNSLDIFELVETKQPNLARKSADYFLSTYKQFLKDKQLTDQQWAEADEEAKRVHEEIYKFAEKITKNENLERIDDDLSDVHLWDLKLEEYLKQHNGAQPNNLDTPLLWTQCVFYRTLVSIFHRSTYFKQFDVFEKTKKGSLLDAEAAATKLIEVTAGIADRIQSGKSTCEEEFESFLQFAVWGNCFDLTWLNASSAGARELHLVDEEKKSRVIANATKEILEHFKSLPNKTTEITIVLDNSGLELLGDLCFVEMLYQTRLIDEQSKVIFHHKKFPWFVSDVTRSDFTWTLDQFQNEFKSEVVQQMGRRWSDLLNREKVWELRSHIFWTCPHPFYEMARLAPDLHQELSKSNLIIFCGDFNYRKLVR